MKSMIGPSPEMTTVRRMIREIARSDDPALIIGEVGSGRNLAAREIHRRSRQAGKPFIVLKCSAVGHTITDADLYGQKPPGPRGTERKPGLFEQAKEGILYMDNIHELPEAYQQQLINICAKKQFRRVGDEEFTKAEFRILAATTDEKIAYRDDFRKDLLALLSTFTLQIPPLRKRKQDIPYLFTHFLENYCEEMNKPLPPVPADLFESLIEYDWRGNVLELENAVRNLVMMSPEGRLSMEYLPFEIKKHPFEFLEDKDLTDAVSEVEKYMIRRTLQKFAGNQTKTAKALNVSEAALRYKMKKYGYSRKSF